MLVRIISGIVGFLLLLAFVVVGGWPLKIGATVISLIGMYELYMAVSKKLKSVHFIGFAAEIYYVFVYNRFYGRMDTIILSYSVTLVAIILMLILLVTMYEEINIHDVSITVFGFLYVGMLLYCLVQLYELNRVLVWLPLLCAWGSDTFAYFVGIKLGRHKLAPILSPKKSVEGSLGGIIGAGILSSLYCMICERLGCINFLDMRYALPLFFMLGMLASVVSQIGDLAASAIKRQMNIKDYGKIMPGHGGILDRFDSVLITAPAIYVLLDILNNTVWEL